jgi:hypothetical protein
MVAEFRRMKWMGQVARKRVLGKAFNEKEYMKGKKKLRYQGVDGRTIHK